MKACHAFAVTVVACGALAAAQSAVTIRYACDETSGHVLADAGPMKLHGRLVAVASEPVQDVSLKVERMDVWCPILRNGVQIKSVHGGSERITADDEMPIVLDRGQDYAMDYAGGRAKALPGGRMVAGKSYLVEASYANRGPTRAKGRTGNSVAFDGLDDYVECGQVPTTRLAGLDIDLWFRLSEKGGAAPVLVSIGETLSLGMAEGRIVFRHVGLRTREGKAVPATRSRKGVVVTQGAWHHLRASSSGSVASIHLDGQQVGGARHLDGAIKVGGPLRLGGTVDPHFFGGAVDDITIRLVPEQATPVAP